MPTLKDLWKEAIAGRIMRPKPGRLWGRLGPNGCWCTVDGEPLVIPLELWMTDTWELQSPVDVVARKFIESEYPDIMKSTEGKLYKTFEAGYKEGELVEHTRMIDGPDNDHNPWSLYGTMTGFMQVNIILTACLNLFFQQSGQMSNNLLPKYHHIAVSRADISDEKLLKLKAEWVIDQMEAEMLRYDEYGAADSSVEEILYRKVNQHFDIKLRRIDVKNN